MGGIINTIRSLLIAASLSGGASAMAEVTPQEAAEAFLNDISGGQTQTVQAYMDNSYVNFLENVKGTDEEMDKFRSSASILDESFEGLKM